MTKRALLALAAAASLALPLAADSTPYAAIDGARLKRYVDELAGMSRRYRDHGHPQFWGRIIGTEADAENARWLADKLKAIGVSDVHEQPFDLPPQWMPRSWSVSVSGGGALRPLASAQPTYRSETTPPGGLDLEAVDVGLATDADLAGRDLTGKAVFFYSTDYMSRHATVSSGAWKRIGERGPAAMFVTLLIPGNLKLQFYPVGSQVPTFALGMEDGLAVREMIGNARGGPPPHVKLELDVAMTPNLKTSTVWGTLPGTADENIVVVAHRDGWFEGANDNGTGVATLVGLAEYFAKIPAAERRRTITFLGTTGHHDGTAESGTWLAAHKDVFAKTALIINCEHTAANQLVSYNGTIRKANVAAPLMWYVGGSPRLEQIALGAYSTFGVATYDRGERSAAGEIGRIQQLAPSLQLIDTGLYWHSDRETPDIIPEHGLAAVTRAFAKIIADVDKVAVKDLQRAAASAQQAPGGSYSVVKTAKVGGAGGFDYVYADTTGRRLYIPRTGTEPRITVFDLDTLAPAGEIAKANARGVAIDPKSGHGFSSSRPVAMWDSKTLAPIKTIPVQGNPDGIMLDPFNQRVWVFSHSLPHATVIDTKDGSIVGTMDLGGAPEQAVTDGSGRIFVDLEDTNAVAVVDAKTMQVTGKYDISDRAKTPAGLAFDVKNHVLFVACRNPAMMVIIDANTGKGIATLPIGTGVDGAVFNPSTMEVFSSQGDGTLTVIKEKSPTSFEVAQTVKTQTSGKTLTLDAKTNQIYVIAAEYGAPQNPPPAGGRAGRGGMIPDSFSILVVGK
jgi:DNA-binding beta-propeller fold protein YncE